MELPELAREDPEENPGEQEPSFERGFWLSSFIVLMIVANIFTAYTYLVRANELHQQAPAIPLSLLYFLGCLSIINFVFAIEIWFWKKWGVYGFYTVAATAFLINITYVGFVNALPGLVGAGLLYLLTRKNWFRFS